MTAPTNPAHATQPDAEYEDQLIWDNDLQERIKDGKGDNALEQTNETGEKKTEEKGEKHSKQRKIKYS
eukprot:1600554-Ditylum_brightwellii.AAC.1